MLSCLQLEQVMVSLKIVCIILRLQVMQCDILAQTNFLSFSASTLSKSVDPLTYLRLCHRMPAHCGPAARAALVGLICTWISCGAAYEISASRQQDSQEPNEHGEWSPSSLLKSTARQLRAVVAGSPIMRSEMPKTRSGPVSLTAEDSDCEWELWGDWTVCQFTCGAGVSLRTREIKHAESSGSCDGNWKEERTCTNGECPVDCTWNDWTDWGSCTLTCGRGISVSTRDAKSAEFGGVACAGASQRQLDCNVDPCPVDCAWSDWSDWSFSASCGPSTKHRHRQVLMPANELGTACEGPTTESTDGAHIDCPVDCQLDDWGRWSLCSVTCGAGKGSLDATPTVSYHLLPSPTYLRPDYI